MIRSILGFLILFSLFILNTTIEAHILVITHAYKRADFIALQDKTLRAFLKDEYQFVVFNDAIDPVTFLEIQNICNDLSLPCIPIPQEIHSRPYLPRMEGEKYDHPCIRCANVVQYSLDTLGFDHNGLVMILDSDMFLTANLNVADYMQDFDIAGLSQSRGHVIYLWNGIMFINMQTLPAKRELSLNCGIVDGQSCDVGGFTYFYFRNHPEARLKLIDHHVFVERHMLEDQNLHHPFLRLMVKENVPNCEFFLNYKLFHYRGGGNWDCKSDEYHQHKTAALHKLINFSMNIDN